MYVVHVDADMVTHVLGFVQVLEDEASEGPIREGLCVCVPLSACAALCVSVYVSLSVCVPVCLCVCVSLCVCLYLRVSLSVSLCVCVSLCLTLCLRVCMCLCVLEDEASEVSIRECLCVYSALQSPCASSSFLYPPPPCPACMHPARRLLVFVVPVVRQGS